MIKKQNSRLTKKKVIVLTLILLLIGLIIYSTIWYTVTRSKYDAYAKGMDINSSGLLMEKIEPSYYSGDGTYEYTVAFPGYLSYVGNLVVSRFKDGLSLFIWPAFAGKSQYGIIINQEGTDYLINISRNLTAEKASDQALVDQYAEDIKGLFGIAKERWSDFE